MPAESVPMAGAKRGLRDSEVRQGHRTYARNFDASPAFLGGLLTLVFGNLAKSLQIPCCGRSR